MHPNITKAMLVSLATLFLLPISNCLVTSSSNTLKLVLHGSGPKRYYGFIQSVWILPDTSTKLICGVSRRLEDCKHPSAAQDLVH